ncbi:MAG TPA: alpha/beta hydrolase [Burkholderiales bacterium]|jgi:pimeloyl-ACP methyl ester carboxylesterase|nr:alpha/beta hydrolase [Burkholderiales bacterium]
MPHITTADGVKLHYEEAGRGLPVVFVHEFAGDWRSWETQMRYFSRSYRCITYSARGYLPSDVPKSVDSYSQDHWRDDILAVIDGLKLERPHVVGLSMGAMAALHFGMKYCAKGAAPRARSLTLAGVGSGAHPATFADFQKSSAANAEFIRKNGMAKFASTYGHGPARLQLQRKDPRGFAEYAQQLSEHSAEGSAHTMAGYQGRRPSLYKLTDEISKVDVPVLILTGDEDEPCLEASVMLKRAIPQAGLAVLAQSGHGINLEEPALFNQLLADFFARAEAGTWGTRDPRTAPATIWGPGGKPG